MTMLIVLLLVTLPCLFVHVSCQMVPDVVPIPCTVARLTYPSDGAWPLDIPADQYTLHYNLIPTTTTGINIQSSTGCICGTGFSCVETSCSGCTILLWSPS